MNMRMMILFPLTFISNIFVDPETMPGWLQVVVDVNPISQLSTAVRGLMAGDANREATGWVLLACAVLVGCFGPLTTFLYRRKG